MYGSATGLPTGSPSASNPSHLTGPSGCSSQPATTAIFSVFASPLRTETGIIASITVSSGAA